MNPLPTNQRGAALVIVLSILVLLVTLLIAFMTSSRNDLVATSQYAAGQEAAALAETATSLVMAQIREATVAGLDAQGRGTHAWASQPGALRVWNNQGQPASPYLYKLYSASRMKEDDLSFLAGEIPPDWRTQTAAYTDVNEPVDRNGTWTYPVLNPAAIGTVEGFSSTQAADPSVAWDARCSMPVRWLYIGRDGTISNSLQPDSVGRVAFWTDDETCKVNINTASATRLNHQIVTPADDSFWDTPRTRMRQDYNMGRFPLREDEFQRYPGHPATVNLLTVLGTTAGFGLPEVFSLTPRYKWGGSENGTVWFNVPESALSGRLSGANRKTERLFASVDELVFAPNRSLAANWPVPPAGRTRQELADSLRFFLTAQSRAPDLNLFGQPRVALWPITQEAGGALRQTVFDRLIAFCATVGLPSSGGEKYYFERTNPLSPTDDWLGIPRNKQLLQIYLLGLTSREIPGFGGGTFLNKYNVAAGGVANEWQQILTQIFDYIRCVNLNETSDVPAGFQSYTTDVEYSAGAQNLGDVDAPGAGLVLPIVITDWNTRGAGRVPMLAEAGFRVIRTKKIKEDPDPNALEVAFLAESFSPMQGPMPWMPKEFALSVTNDAITPFRIEGEQVFPDGLSTPSDFSPAANFSSGQVLGGLDGFSWILRSSSTSLAETETLSGYPFKRNRGDGVPIPPGATQFTIDGGKMNVSFRMAGVAYQTYELDFPLGTAKVPEVDVSDAQWQKNRDGGANFLFGPSDVVKSVSLYDGDFRIAAYLPSVPSAFFRADPRYASDPQFAHGFARVSGMDQWHYRGGRSGGYVSGLAYPEDTALAARQATRRPKIRADVTDLRSSAGRPADFSSAIWEGDFDTGVGTAPDGPYLGKSDEGHYDARENTPTYFDITEWSRASGFFSPTKQVPSAVVFGSLPTGVKRTERAYRTGNYANGRPWRTLLFTPAPLAGSSHFGLTAPADRLLLDLFHLPVVEPYAISEPFSTAGRINMNTQIMPFTTLVRESGLHAVLASQRVTALQPAHAADYKTNELPPVALRQYRYRINRAETLKQFHARFAPNGNAAQGDLFRSAVEICSIFFVPNISNAATGVAGPTLTSAGIQWSGTDLSVPAMQTWWQGYTLTGDNLRERPYATIYPLLTTKSNSYTVHIRAQALAEGKNVVTGEYRGSTTIERYVDPADARIGGGEPDGIDPDTQSLEPLYRFRVVDTKRFAP